MRKMGKIWLHNTTEDIFYCHGFNGIAVGFLYESLKVYDFK